MPTPEEFYSDTQRELQKEGQTEKLAQAVFQAVVRDELEEPHSQFIETRDFFFLSSVNGSGEPTVSYKGGAVGFVQVISPNRIIFPNYDGNGMWFSLGNIQESSKIGILFIDMETPWRVRVQGRATLSDDPELIKRFPGCNKVIDVTVDSVFQNCARYMHKHQRVDNSPYVPDEQGDQPYPSWKRIDMIQDVLHPDDIGRAEQEGGTISLDDYFEKVIQGES